MKSAEKLEEERAAKGKSMVERKGRRRQRHEAKGKSRKVTLAQEEGSEGAEKDKPVRPSPT